MKTERLKPGDRFGSLTILEYVKNDCYKAQCDCGNISYPTKHNLLTGHTRSCGNCGKNSYRLCDDGATVELISTNGYKILIDAEDEEKVRGYKWHVTKDQKGNLSVMSSNRVYLHQLLLGFPEGEVDHINLNRLDNRKKNLRAVTHQQNQMNQPLQKKTPRVFLALATILLGRSTERESKSVSMTFIWVIIIRLKKRFRPETLAWNVCSASMEGTTMYLPRQTGSEKSW